MATIATDVNSEEKPWHAAFPTPSGCALEKITVEELRSLLKDSDDDVNNNKSFLVVDVRRTDFEVSLCRNIILDSVLMFTNRMHSYVELSTSQLILSTQLSPAYYPSSNNIKWSYSIVRVHLVEVLVALVGIKTR